MSKKQTAFKTRGMNRDLSVSAFNPDFAFENINLRLQTNENNTLMSWVNERGTQLIGKRVTTYTDYWTKEGEEPVYEDPEDATWEHHRKVDLSTEALSFSGIVIGNAVLNHQLVLFTTEKGNGILKPDHIYVCTYSNAEKTDMTVRELYHGRLNFNVLYPLETHVSYESGHVQKVYWTDGLNQPRVINIAADDAHVDMWNTRQAIGTDTWFDFIPSTGGVGNVSVQNSPGSGGTFAPGVIQYCITYFNKYGQQSNVVWVTPLYYLVHTDRGGSPEGKVSNVLTITITGIDTTFDYIRLYSVQRTSIDAVPLVKVLEDLKIAGTGPIVFTDNGTVGYTVDPTELLYAGGKEISCLTMTSKDDTLFMGNIVEQHVDVQKIQQYFDSNKVTPAFITNREIKSLGLLENNGFYSYMSTLDKSGKAITTFKGGERYRLGIQLQKATGEWTAPIFLNDVDNSIYPVVSSGSVLLPYAEGGLNFNVFADASSDYYIPDFFTTYKKVRTVVAYPDIAHRRVLCQGVLNPTVFNVEDRVTNSPFAQASWYFRPYNSGSSSWESMETCSYTAYSDATSEEEISSGTLTYTGNHFEYNGSLYNEVTVVQTSGTGLADGSYYIQISFRYRQRIPVYTRSGDTLTEVENTRIVLESEGRPQSIDDAFTVSIALSSEEPNTDCDPYFADRSMYSDVYVLMATVPTDIISSILSKGYITVRSSSDIESNHSFKAFRVYGPELLYQNYYVFISDTSWPDPSTNTYLDGLADIYRQELDTADPDTGNVTLTSQLCSCFAETFDHRLYYRKPAWSSNPSDSSATEETDPVPEECVFRFKFKNNGNMYACTASFVSMTSADDGKTGSSVEFSHYSSIYAQSDYVRIGANARQIEIHGSKNVYNSVFDAKKDNLESNTQFFIDQSIVTLNSPDIDFDPMLQGFGTEGLSLRVIGVIPITGNASYHKIKTASAMLESYHNYHDWHVHRFGNGERDYYIMYGNGEGTGRLVSDYLWNDVEIVNNPDEEDKIHSDGIHDYLVYPWQRSGSLNNDFRSNDVASSLLGSKKESTLLYSNNTYYVSSPVMMESVSCQFHFTENEFVTNLRLDNPMESTLFGSINYYPNIDKILYNREGYSPITYDGVLSREENSSLTSPVSMKYKSTSHAILALGNSILPMGNETYGRYKEDGGTTTFWGESIPSVEQGNIELPKGMFKPDDTPYDFLWLGELYRTNPIAFGDVKDENWIPCSEPVTLTPSVSLQWLYGDTYFQRYDCLKTYPFTNEDPNQLIEILSFLCETRVNIDGRYDRNRGQIDNTNMSPQNFNLLNLAYSQKDNFFSYKMADEDVRTSHHYPNMVTYGKTKTSGADIDLWTNVNLGSMLEMDGNKDEITKLVTWNSQIFCFQDKGISQVLYNENTALTTKEGVPVEIANSEKVQGKRYVTDGIGCSDKWSVVSTPNGIYFIDSNEKSIYCLGGELQNLSQNNGFSTWCKLNLPAGSVEWTPDNPVNFVSFYNVQNKEVLFVNKYYALAWSEKLNVFTSFYDYNNTSGFASLDDTGVWMKGNDNGGLYARNSSLWKHQSGDYCRFFGENRPYSMTLIGNPEPLIDKIFTNVEFRACADGEGSMVTGEDGKERYMPVLPFDYTEAWNEYQHGVALLQTKFSHPAHQHHLGDTTATLKRKFRIWRCDIPRDNANMDGNVFTEHFDDTFRLSRIIHPQDRMRNPWIYLKMYKGAAIDEVIEDWRGNKVIVYNSLPRTEIHDMVMTYYV